MNHSFNGLLAVAVAASLQFAFIAAAHAAQPSEAPSAASNVAAKTGEAIEKGAKVAGEAVGTTALRTGAGIEHGAKKVGAAVRQAAEKTGEVLATTAERTKAGFKNGAEKIEHGAARAKAALTPGSGTSGN